MVFIGFYTEFHKNRTKFRTILENAFCSFGMKKSVFGSSKRKISPHFTSLSRNVQGSLQASFVPFFSLFYHQALTGHTRILHWIALKSHSTFSFFKIFHLHQLSSRKYNCITKPSNHFNIFLDIFIKIPKCQNLSYNPAPLCHFQMLFGVHRKEQKSILRASNLSRNVITFSKLSQSKGPFSMNQYHFQIVQQRIQI